MTTSGVRTDTDEAGMVGKYTALDCSLPVDKEEEEISPIDIFTDKDMFIIDCIQNTLKHKGV